jgi:DNA-binding NarL/FixJ family response regulator
MRILLVDDHAMFSAGTRRLLLSYYADAEIAEAKSGEAAMERVKEFKPEAVIMDLHLPDGDGIEVSARILEHLPSAKIILLSGDSDLSYVDRALKKGIAGYLLKASAPEELALAVQVVMAGKLYLCPEANATVLESYRQNLSAVKPAAKPLLSARELEVLRYVSEGLRSKEIAARLEVAVKTVETYRRRLMLKLQCDSTAELVRYAIRKGVVHL